MTVRATLWKYEPRKDGTCNIKIYISNDGKKRYERTPHYVRPEEWDNNLGRLKAKSPLAKRINALLTRTEREIKGRLVGLNGSLIKLIADYLEECRNGENDLKPGTWKKFIGHYNHLQAYMVAKGIEDIGFADVTLQFYTDFNKYLKKKGVGRSGVANNIKHLKKFMQIGLDLELHSNVAFKAKAFKAERIRPNDKIYLSTAEINSLADLNLSSRPALEKERDRFLVSYYMVLRYGDSIRISQANITRHGGHHYYKNIAEKTETVSFVPIKPAALDLIKKHNYNLSGDTNQEANRKLKTIAAMAGILTNMAGPGGGNIPKSSMVTTHTARRSAATNLLLSGVPLSEIMQLGGWKFEATLKQYLLAGGIKLAQLSAGREFFR
jgi:site-specific recombinase XerD